MDDERYIIPAQDFINLAGASDDAIGLMRRAGASLIEQGKEPQSATSDEGMALRTLGGNLEDLAEHLARMVEQAKGEIETA